MSFVFWTISFSSAIWRRGKLQSNFIHLHHLTSMVSLHRSARQSTVYLSSSRVRKLMIWVKVGRSCQRWHSVRISWRKLRFLSAFTTCTTLLWEWKTRIFHGIEKSRQWTSSVLHGIYNRTCLTCIKLSDRRKIHQERFIITTSKVRQSSSLWRGEIINFFIHNFKTSITERKFFNEIPMLSFNHPRLSSPHEVFQNCLMFTISRVSMLHFMAPSIRKIKKKNCVVERETTVEQLSTEHSG